MLDYVAVRVCADEVILLHPDIDGTAWESCQVDYENHLTATCIGMD